MAVFKHQFYGGPLDGAEQNYERAARENDRAVVDNGRLRAVYLFSEARNAFVFWRIELFETPQDDGDPRR